MATCTSKLSRNFQLGELIGQGMSLVEAKIKVGQVAEGIRTLEVLHQEASAMKINMPIVESLYKILFDKISSEQLVQDLLDHPNEVDVEFTYKE